MKKNTIYQILKHVISIILSIIVIAPFYLVIINSFKSRPEAARMSLALPSKWMFSNYWEVIEKGKLLQGFFNSSLYAITATTVAILTCAMAAFVICRNKTKLNTFIYYFIICGLFFPINYVTLVKVLKVFNLSGTRVGLILVFTSTIIPFCVFTIRNFIKTVPIELDEAAVIDGAGPLRIFFKIIVPLLTPVLATCFILQFMGIWSDFLTPLYLLNKSSAYPMNLAVYQFFGKNSTYWNYIFADIVLTCVPVIVVYLIGQKYIIGGMTSGSVKG